jgi:hypothetical protein
MIEDYNPLSQAQPQLPNIGPDEMDMLRAHGFEFIGYYVKPLPIARGSFDLRKETILIFERTDPSLRRTPLIGVDRIRCSLKDRPKSQRWSVNDAPTSYQIASLRDLVNNLQRQSELLEKHLDGRLYTDGRSYNPKVTILG